MLCPHLPAADDLEPRETGVSEKEWLALRVINAVKDPSVPATVLTLRASDYERRYGPRELRLLTERVRAEFGLSRNFFL